MQAVLDAAASGALPAKVAIVISNNRDSGALRRAAAAGVPAVRLSSATHPDSGALDQAIVAALTDAGVDVVFLAGYMKKLGPRVLAAYRERILNTHPALLPKFGGQGMYGDRVHAAVLAAGERETGASIHLVDAEYDTGRVLAQCRVPVLPGDSVEQLAARVQAREKALVVDTLARIATGTLAGWSPAPR